MAAPSTHQWFKSSYSGGSGTECVECAPLADGVMVRDSKRVHGVTLTIKSRAWQPFVKSLKQRGAEEANGP